LQGQRSIIPESAIGHWKGPFLKMAYKKSKNKEAEISLPFKLPLSAPQRTVFNKYFFKKRRKKIHLT